MNDARKNPTEVQAAAQATKPQFFVINDTLYYQAKAGDELKFDLDFPGEIFEKVMTDDLEQRDQFLLMLDALGDGAMVARVKKMGALEQTRLIIGFFREFQKAAGATVGESDGSSDS
jgi:hypothetical protein